MTASSTSDGSGVTMLLPLKEKQHVSDCAVCGSCVKTGEIELLSEEFRRQFADSVDCAVENIFSLLCFLPFLSLIHKQPSLPASCDLSLASLSLILAEVSATAGTEQISGQRFARLQFGFSTRSR